MQKVGYNSRLRRVAQPGSALAWGARGREFESRHADHQNQRVTSHKDVARFSLGPRSIKRNKAKSPTFWAGLDAYEVVGRAGFEPATNGLKVRCSTN